MKKKTKSLPLEKYPLRLRVDQVAAFLDASETHVISLIKSGALPAVNLALAGAAHAYYRIERDALAAYVKKSKVAP